MTDKRFSRVTLTLVAAAVASVALMGFARAGHSAPVRAPSNTFLITEVGLSGQTYVALKNIAKTPGTLRGLYLCQGRRCYALPKKTVKPGKTVRIARRSGAGLSNVVARRATFGRLVPRGGEIALYTSRSLNNPKAMLAYLEWGSAQHALTSVAIKAGLWLKGRRVATQPTTKLLFRTKDGLWASR
jgi:hypothetical protein